MEAFAIGNPGISFLFTSNGNERLSTEGSGDLFDTIVALYRERGGRRTYPGVHHGRAAEPERLHIKTITFTTEHTTRSS